MAGKKAKWARLSRARKELGPAFKSTWPYTLVGLAVGIGIAWLPDAFPLCARPPLKLILEHVGVGFIVSAIAVFFYEWGAHTKKALELSEQLSSTIRNDLVPIALATGEVALLRGLESLLKESSSVGHQYVPVIITEVDLLVKAVRRLQQDGIWVREQYIQYIAETLATIRSNSECLASLQDEKVHNFVVPPDGLDPVDKVLAAQMNSLDEEDSYDVITNLISWRARRLSGLVLATRSAVKTRRVGVRRVFNPLFHVEMSGPEVRQILAEQLKEAAELGELFQVRILFEEHVNASDSERLKAFAWNSHFGLFIHNGKKLHIELKKLDLSEVAMKAGDLKFEAELFDAAFKAAAPLTEELIEKCVALFPATLAPAP